MEKEKIKIGIPVVVEGKYDKIKLSSVIDAHIITTDGFGLFKSREKACLIKQLCENGIIVLTDSDGGGRVIRSRLSSEIPKNKIYNLYIPAVQGKEKRKAHASKEGLLGVEGIDADTLRELFSDFVSRHGSFGERRGGESATSADFYELGLTGGADSRKKRDEFSTSLGLPPGMTANSLLAAVNVLMPRDELFLRFEEAQNTEKEQ